MNFLIIQDFLDLFSSNHLSFKQFLNTMKVRVNRELYSLEDYRKKMKKRNRDITDNQLEFLYNSIKGSKEYLKRFYDTSLKIKSEFGTMRKIAPMKKSDLSNNRQINFKNVIRNLYFTQLMETTTSGFNNIPSYLTVLKELLNKNIVDYKLISKSSLDFIEKRRFGSVLSSLYFRASILNPYLVYSLNKSVLHGKKIFTPTLGWSSYAYGFCECLDVEEYVGTDVISEVCDKTRQLCSQYSQIKSKIFCQPSESLLTNKFVLNNYKNHFDVVFFSPPYFQLEMYEGEEQSTTNYKTYEDWLNKYWKKTVELCNFVLQKRGTMCYIISDYGSNNTKQHYELVKDTKKIATKFFDSFTILPLANKNVHVTKHRETGEQIIICKKKN